MKTETGIVIKSTGSWYKVRAAKHGIVNARLSGKHKIKGLKSTNPLAVGDHVNFIFENSGDEPSGVIQKIHPRKNYIVRKSIKKSAQAHLIASNIDQAVLVVTIAEPSTSLGFIDRFLVTCESFRIPVQIVFNKADLFTEGAKEYYEAVADMYRSIGYESTLTSTLDKTGLEDLQSLLQGKISLLSGHSGTGKSSLINAIYPSQELRIGDISSSHLKGKHTTTFAEMFELEQDTYVIDSPGIKELGLFDLDKENLSHYFPEMREVIGQCKFHNCTHIHEPKCKVIELVEEGVIPQSRYESYLSMFEGEDHKY